MFTPSQADVRRFFCSVHAKQQGGTTMEAIEVLAGHWIAEHPEYHATLSDLDAALAQMGSPGDTRDNPFLHLSMHLSITEQMSIDQPRGIKPALDKLAAKRSSMHDAHHDAMEALGEMVWAAQRNGSPFDGEAYIARILSLATR